MPGRRLLEQKIKCQKLLSPKVSEETWEKISATVDPIDKILSNADQLRHWRGIVGRSLDIKEI